MRHLIPTLLILCALTSCQGAPSLQHYLDELPPGATMEQVAKRLGRPTAISYRENGTVCAYNVSNFWQIRILTLTFDSEGRLQLPQTATRTED